MPKFSCFPGGAFFSEPELFCCSERSLLLFALLNGGFFKTSAVLIVVADDSDSFESTFVVVFILEGEVEEARRSVLSSASMALFNHNNW